MSFCPECGTSVAPHDAFCGNCGHAVAATTPPAAASPLAPPPPPTSPPLPPSPPPPATVPVPGPTVLMPASTEKPLPAATPMTDRPPNRRGGLMVLVALLAVAAIVGGIVVLSGGDDGDGDSADTTVLPTEVTTDDDGAGDTTPPGDTAPAPTVASTTAAPTTTLDPVTAATQALQQRVAGDQATADALQGTYVPQLSAKRVGLTVDGVTYGPVEILADHDALDAQYGAILVDAGRYDFQNNGQPMTGWFLTIVPQTFPSKDAATQWCTDHALGPNQCFGRLFKNRV